MSWVHMQRYRFRAVPGQAAIPKNETTGTRRVEVMAECTLGPMLGSRGRWRGYLNSSTNQETSVAELRVMGWRGARLGDWAGIGSVEFEATMVSEVGTNGKTYWRLAWPRAVPTIKAENVSDAELAELNAQMGGLLTKPSAAAPLPPPPTPADAGEEEASLPF